MFEAVLSSETSTLQIIKHYEQAVQQYTVEQTDRNFQAMMAAQEAMDRHEAWDYNAEIKRFYLN